MSSSVLTERLAGDGGGRRREIVTPEGVPLVFRLAGAGERVGGFLIDMSLQGLLLLGIGLAFAFSGLGGSGWFGALMLLLFFLVRTTYFIWFELRWQGRTPGKRLVGERVIDAQGGTLPAEAVVVRNLTREVETFLPLFALLNPSLVVGIGPAWVRWVAVLWTGIFLFLPLLNRDRRRLGDLLAGTIVVRDARALLSTELGAVKRAGPAPASAPQFTRAQLEQYGVYELQVLEDLLRQRGVDDDELELIAQRIRRKIAWEAPGREPRPREFLEAFYRAQRSRLERDLVLGKARERKREGTLRDG